MFGMHLLYQLIKAAIEKKPSLAKRQVYKKAGASLLVLSDERTNIFQQRLTQSLQQQQQKSTGSAYYDSNLISEGLRCSSFFSSL